MPHTPLRNPQIANEAAAWAIYLDAGKLSPAQSRELADWLLESPRHVEELLLASAIFEDLGHVDNEKSISINDLLAAAAPEVIPILRKDSTYSDKPDSEALPASKKRRWRAGAGLTAAVAVLGVIVFGLLSRPNPDYSSEKNIRMAFNNDNDASTGFATQLGEQRRMTLEDGSIIHVNTQSEVAIRFAQHQRIVELLRGEALFEVAHDPERPFRVIAGDTVAEAVGTTFNVYLEGEHTSVAVIEGKVAVETSKQLVNTPASLAAATLSMATPDSTGTAYPGSPKPLPIPDISRTDDGRLLLTAGQRADLEVRAQTVQVAEVNIKTVQSWRIGQLVFESDDLASIAAQFNRYNRTRIEIMDERVAGTRFSGIFDADDPESLIKFLRLTGDISVDQSDPATIKLSSK